MNVNFLVKNMHLPGQIYFHIKKYSFLCKIQKPSPYMPILPVFFNNIWTFCYSESTWYIDTISSNLFAQFAGLGEGRYSAGIPYLGKHKVWYN